MSVDRREFLYMAAGAAAGLVAAASPTQAAPRPKIKALAFDGFPIFDPRPVFALAEKLFPGKGAELSNAWRIRQFEYQWLRALSGQYADFWQVTEDALVYSTKLLKLELLPETRKQLMDAYLALKAWPDVLPALRTFKSAGIRMAFLSNLTAKVIEANVKNAGLEGFFEDALSTDKIKTYKPDPRAYQMGVDAFKLKREEILFVAFGGWDAAGAKSFGYPTFWVNRLNLPVEELGVMPDGVGPTATDLVSFLNIPQ